MKQSALGLRQTVVPYRREPSAWIHKLWLILAILFALGANYADGRGMHTSRLWIYAAVFAFLTVTAFWLPGSDGPSAQIGIAGFTWPWLTTGLVAVISVVFALEQKLAVAPPLAPMTPALATLVAFGGLSRTLVESGQWWRMLTAPFLHASLVHLVGNVLALVFAGSALERFAGRTWTLWIFLTGALAGSAGSLIFNPPEIVTVGSSGAIMALIAASFVMSFRLPAGGAKARVQAYSVRIAIPALIPAAQSAATMHIDYGAHTGGAAYGALLGLMMLVTWPAGSPLPRRRCFAAAMTAAGMAGCGATAYLAAQSYPAFAGVSLPISAAEAPKPQEFDSPPGSLPSSPVAGLTSRERRACAPYRDSRRPCTSNPVKR